LITVIPLQFAAGNKWVHIRELCGNDEQSVAGTRSIDAIILLNRLLQIGPEAEHIVKNSESLTIPDRDSLLIAVYIDTYGFKIETAIACSFCKNRFEINFSLEDLKKNLHENKYKQLKGNDLAYPFKVPGGMKFRLPTGEDEMAVMGFEPERSENELLKRCLPEGTQKFDKNILQKAMQKVGPLADAEIEAQCHECSGMHMLHFNLQQYLLSSLIKERETLVAEVQLLAKTYGWGLNEILELPRSSRRSFVTASGSI
jgi:hypothetical protein